MGVHSFLENKMICRKVCICLIAYDVYVGFLSVILNNGYMRESGLFFIDENFDFRYFRVLFGKKRLFAYVALFFDEFAVESLFVGLQEKARVGL